MYLRSFLNTKYAKFGLRELLRRRGHKSANSANGTAAYFIMSVSAENVCLLFCIVILYFRGFDHMGAGGYLPDCVSCLTCVWRGGE